MKFRLIDCKPVPARLYDELVACGVGRDIHLNSCDRSQEGVSYARSQGCQLSSQQELWDGWVARRPGFNPANPPGRSTHERRNDGVAFAGPVGMWLPYYKVGIDNSNSPLLCQRARARGWVATLTYPGSAREAQHVNFRKEPKLNVFRPLRKGSKGRRVRRLTERLDYLGYDIHRTGGFGDRVEAAVKHFQHDWHLSKDGVVGVHTWKQIEVAVRGKKACRKQALEIKDPAERAGALTRCGRRWGARRR